MTSPLAQAAAKIRADIKAGAPELPPYPAQAVIRVRSRRASLMSAIDVEVENVPRSWLIEDGTPNRRSNASLLLAHALREITERHYEADGRGSFISVQFHFEEA